MPSDFTAPIESDPNDTLRAFALRACFAFLMEGREGEAVKRFRDHDPRLQDRVWAAQAEIAELEEMTPEQIENACNLEYQKALDYHLQMAADFAEKEARYLRMEKLVEEWNPPVELLNLKSYMLEQIEGSRPPESLPPRKELPGDWHENRLEWAKRDLKNSEARLQKVTEVFMPDPMPVPSPMPEADAAEEEHPEIDDAVQKALEAIKKVEKAEQESSKKKSSTPQPQKASEKSAE